MAKPQGDGNGTIGERIAQARLSFGARRKKACTQKELADTLSVTPGTISQWESDTTKPEHDTWPRLADALGTYAEWLAWGRGEAEAPLPVLNVHKPTRRYGTGESKRDAG